MSHLGHVFLNEKQVTWTIFIPETIWVWQAFRLHIRRVIQLMSQDVLASDYQNSHVILSLIFGLIQLSMDCFNLLVSNMQTVHLGQIIWSKSWIRKFLSDWISRFFHSLIKLWDDFCIDCIRMKSIKSPKKGEKGQKGGNHNVKQWIHKTMWDFFVFNLWWLRHINIIAPSDIEVPKKIFSGKLPDTVHFQCPQFRLKIAFPTQAVDRLWTGCGPSGDHLGQKSALFIEQTIHARFKYMKLVNINLLWDHKPFVSVDSWFYWFICATRTGAYFSVHDSILLTNFISG